MFRTTHTARRIATAIVAGLTLMAVASSVAVAGIDRPDGYQPQLQATSGAFTPDVFKLYAASHRDDDVAVISYLSQGITQEATGLRATPDGYQPQLQAAAETDVIDRYVANHRQDTEVNVIPYLSHGSLSSSAPSGAALRETPDGFQPQLNSDRVVLGSEHRLDRRDWGLMGGAALAAMLVALAAMQFAGRNRGRLKNA